MSARANRAAADVLPPKLAELVDALGFPATLKLVERWGGVRLYVPLEQNLTDEHELVQVLGLAAARKLAAAHKEWLEVPRAAAYLRQVRDRIIRESYGGKSASRLARQFGMTRRNIFYIVAREEAPELQGDLFKAG